MRPASQEFREGFRGILPEAEVGSASCTREDRLIQPLEHGTKKYTEGG